MDETEKLPNTTEATIQPDVLGDDAAPTPSDSTSNEEIENKGNNLVEGLSI